MENNNVNHPRHYNSHPSGVECITIARHHNFNLGNTLKYIWRAGLKQEYGLTSIQKELEDCEKAAWYLNDHIEMLKSQIRDENHKQ